MEKLNLKNGWTLVDVNRKIDWVLLEGYCRCGAKTGETMPRALANDFSQRAPECDECMTPPDFASCVNV